MTALANAHGISVNETVNDALRGMEEGKDIVRSAVEEEKSKVESVISQVHQQLDSYSEKLSNKVLESRCFKVCNKNCFLQRKFKK